MYSVFCNVLPIVLIALIGSFIRKKWLISDEFWRGLEKLSFYILFPAVLFGSTYRLELAATQFFRLVIALVISNLIISDKHIDFYNDYRPHSYLNGMTPNKFEQNYYKKMDC